MFKNYIKIAFQNLRKNPGYALINIGGLGIGFACCLLIFQYVAFENSFDEFHENARDIHYISWTRVQNEGEPNTMTTTGWAVGPAIAEGTPEVLRFARIHPEYFSAVISNTRQPELTFSEEKVYYVDDAFLQMFTFPLVSGNAARALAPGTLLLSQTAAKKYFGNEDPIGQTLDVRGWFGGDFQYSGIVNGVFRDVPANSHLQFDFLLPMDDLFPKSDYNDLSSGWGWNNFITYVQLRADADPSDAERKFSEIYRKNREKYFQKSNVTAYVTTQPLQNIYLNEDQPIPNALKGSSRSVSFFTIIGLITLLIALVNYINLATSSALSRAREVGVRKAIGAHKSQLVIQFLCESALTIFIGTMLGFALAALVMATANPITGVNQMQAIWTLPGFWKIFPVFFLIVVLLSGLYPALMLSSFKPMEVLKGNTGTFTGGTGMRRGLIVFQFAISIALLVGTMVVYKQVNYMQHMDLGMDLEQILTIPGPRSVPGERDKGFAIETFTRELYQIPSVLKVATSNSVPGKGFSFETQGLRKATADQAEEIHASGAAVDTSFMSLYGLELAAGDIRSGAYRVPEGEPARIMINETAAYALGFDSPEDALGEELSHGRVVGVMKDFNWSSAHLIRGNTIFYLSANNPQISIKVGTADLPRTIAAVEALYRRHFPGNPFEYAFVDEQFDRQYKNDLRFMRLFTAFTALAIFIACLGLLGLATFTARRRTKEIGIRKVLGASISSMAVMLSSDFVKLVMIAFVIASPIAWYVMGKWLESYAYRIDMEWWMFAASGFGAVVIALMTVSFQAIKAAIINPVESLRSE